MPHRACNTLCCGVTAVAACHTPSFEKKFVSRKTDFIMSSLHAAAFPSSRKAFKVAFLRIGLYFPFSYLENGSIKIARSLGVRDDDGKPKKVSGQKTGKWFSHPAKGDLKCWKVIRKWFTILLLTYTN